MNECRRYAIHIGWIPGMLRTVPWVSGTRMVSPTTRRKRSLCRRGASRVSRGVYRGKVLKRRRAVVASAGAVI